MTRHTIAHPALASARSGRRAGAVLRFGLEHYVWLPLGGLIGLTWANTAESYFGFAHQLSFPVNEIGMALFFALITQEIVEEMMPDGALHTWRRWMLPLVAAAGGAAGSALVYLTYVALKYEPILNQGWLVAGAFDIAFAYFVVKSIFKRHPAVSFLLVMAIATNVVGMIVVGLRYQPVTIRPGGTALMAAALGVAMILRRRKVHSFWPYLVACGPLSWWALYLDGFHPALALVPIVPFLPHQPRSVDGFENTTDAPPSSPRHFEHEWNYAVQAVLFLFGLVNAGVLLHRHGTGTWALLAAALAGRPLGILAAVGVAVWLGMRLPPRLHWRDLVVVALAASSGFTFALFAAVALYPAGPILAELTLGAVMSGVGVIAAFATARILKVGRFTMARTTPVFTAVAFVAAVTIAGAAAQHDAQPASLAQFNAAIHQYVQLHRQIERQLPPFRAHSDAQDVFESSNAMASALQTARAAAREGDIFTREVAALLRTRVSDALTAHGFLPEEMVAGTLEEADEEAPLPVVNGRFPWRRGAAMWPCVLDALPRLPHELQYRFIGRDLVLVDTHADVIVDILRNAVR